MPVSATYLIKEQVLLSNVDREIFYEAFECQPCIFVSTKSCITLELDRWLESWWEIYNI
jgi:hypothetical protein